MPYWFLLDDLLQNGIFTSEFGIRYSYFGRKTSEFAVYKYVFVEIALSYYSTLPFSRSYRLLVSEGSELESNAH
jgi:hypothetical protein